MVLSVFVLSIGPFHKDIGQVMSRLFPFKRGLCHAYWAANFWSLYSFMDRILLFGACRFCLLLLYVAHASWIAAKLLGIQITGQGVVSSTRGLVGDSVFAVLPNIPPMVSLVLTVASQSVCVALNWHNVLLWLSSLRCTSFGSALTLKLSSRV